MKLYRISPLTLVNGCQPGWTVWVAKLGLAVLVALTMLVTTTLALPGQARAAENAPFIKFLSPIYPGQPGGHAEGPVGTLVDVQGGNWPSTCCVSITLADEANDTPGQPGSACTNGSEQVQAPGIDPQAGEFTQTFRWPASANKVGHSYWACGSVNGSPPSLGISTFTVLSASPPSLHVDGPTVVQGRSVPVTGQNWLPGSQQITVFVGTCVSCQNASKKQVTAKNDGTFNILVPLPGNVGAGATIFVYAASQPTGPTATPALTAGNDGSLSLTVVDQPTPTPTTPPTATPTPLPTATPVVTATAIPGPNTPDSSGDNLPIVLLSVLSAALALGAIVTLFLFLRMRQTGVRRMGLTSFDAPPPRPGRHSGPRAIQPGRWNDQDW